MSRTAERVKTEIENAGYIYDENQIYSLTTPAKVAAHEAAGKTRVCSYEDRLGETYIVLCDSKPKKKSLWSK